MSLITVERAKRAFAPRAWTEADNAELARAAATAVVEEIKHKAEAQLVQLRDAAQKHVEQVKLTAEGRVAYGYLLQPGIHAGRR